MKISNIIILVISILSPFLVLVNGYCDQSTFVNSRDYYSNNNCYLIVTNTYDKFSVSVNNFFNFQNQSKFISKTEPYAEIYKIQDHKKMFINSIKLLNQFGPYTALISNNGKYFVTLANYIPGHVDELKEYNNEIAFYNIENKKCKSYKLSDLIDNIYFEKYSYRPSKFTGKNWLKGAVINDEGNTIDIFICYGLKNS